MAHAELDRLEGDVQEARQRLKSDLEVLRAPGTFASFKDELVEEARQSRDNAIARATSWSERLLAEIKQRATANPVAVGAIAAEAVRRLIHPAPANARTMIWVAAVAIGVNLVTALLFARGRERDINVRAAFQHMAADAAVSAE